MRQRYLRKGPEHILPAAITVFLLLLLPGSNQTKARMCSAMGIAAGLKATAGDPRGGDSRGLTLSGTLVSVKQRLRKSVNLELELERPPAQTNTSSISATNTSSHSKANISPISASNFSPISFPTPPMKQDSKHALLREKVIESGGRMIRRHLNQTTLSNTNKKRRSFIEFGNVAKEWRAKKKHLEFVSQSFTYSSSFQGPKPGFFYGRDEARLGYHWDEFPYPTKEEWEELVLLGTQDQRNQKDQAVSSFRVVRDEKGLVRTLNDPTANVLPPEPNIKVTRDGLEMPSEWKGVVEEEIAHEHIVNLMSQPGKSIHGRYQNLFIPPPPNSAARFEGWKQGYYFGTGPFGSGYYRDFYQDLLLLAKQNELAKNGSIKTIEQLKIEESIAKGNLEIKGPGTNRFKGLDESGNPIDSRLESSGPFALHEKTVEKMDQVVDGEKVGEIVFVGYKNMDGVGLPDMDEHKEQGRTFPLQMTPVDDLKAHLLRDDISNLNMTNLRAKSDYRTKAQKNLDKMWMGNLAKRRNSVMQGKSYRERIQQMNQKLSQMTEFHDMLRITEFGEFEGKDADRLGRVSLKRPR